MKDPYAFDLLQKLRAFIDDANVDDAILAANLEHSIERYQRLVFKHGVRRIIECYGIRAIEVKYPDVKRAFRSIVMALIAFNGPKKIQVEGWNEVSAGILGVYR
jgi:hypothetical protein